MASTARLGSAVNRPPGHGRVPTTELMLTMLPPPGVEVFHRFLGGEQQAEHIQVELLVEMFLGRSSSGANS